MKSALRLLGLTVLFFLVFLAGTLWDPFGLKWFVTHPTLTSTRYFVPDGLFIVLILYLFFIIAAAIRRRFTVAAIGLPTLALILALALGLLAKIGLATHDLY